MVCCALCCCIMSCLFGDFRVHMNTIPSSKKAISLGTPGSRRTLVCVINEHTTTVVTTSLSLVCVVCSMNTPMATWLCVFASQSSLVSAVQANQPGASTISHRASSQIHSSKKDGQCVAAAAVLSGHSVCAGSQPHTASAAFRPISSW